MQNHLCRVLGYYGRNKRTVANSFVWLFVLSIINTVYSFISIATTSSISLTINDTVSLDIIASTEGSFSSSDTASSNLSVLTNHGTGYTLGIRASASSNSLINSVDNTKTIPSIMARVSPTDFADDANKTTYNNTYGYRPSKYHSSNNTYFLPTPTNTESSDILDATTSANASIANNYNISLGARIDTTLAPGSYTNTFVITVIANPTPYSITYESNTTDTVTDMPTNVVNNSTYGETVNLSNGVPVRSNYNFAGWCTVQTVDDASCSGTQYNPNGDGTNLSWSLDQTAASNQLTLYAMWAGNTATCASGSHELYCKVSEMSQGTQTVSELSDEITANNSGVFEYDDTVFGVASDLSNDYPIYYYRGVLDSNLDSTTNTYGSKGDGETWHNYVRLGNTCWRIVRTTGSGGVKMIYNGTYGDTTANTCANATTKAQTRYSGSELKIAYNISSTNKAGKTYTGIGSGIHAAGYTYSNVSDTSTSYSQASSLFGSTGNDTTTNSNSSVIKKYIEDWYNSNLTGYTSILETSAGFCNDRTLGSSTTWTSPLSDSSLVQVYKSTGATAYYFGAYVRNTSNTRPPTLTCNRGVVDTYSTTTDTGNGQLTYPIALLTADEVAFAGSGGSEISNGPTYNFNSFIHSKNKFWLLSPSDRQGSPQVFYLDSTGKLNKNSVNYTPYGVRPVISLNHDVEYTSGTGTATNPWVVALP